jgi:hypothetical protein
MGALLLLEPFTARREQTNVLHPAAEPAIQ